MLPLNGDYVIVTKSLKDVMCLYEFGIPAIAPCSENLFLTDNQYVKLKQHFKDVAILYDNDLPGIIAANKIRKQHPDLKVLLLNRNEAKDFSDYRKRFGYQKTLELVKKVKEHYGKE